jgi:broad specificity phosphatase PhoE
VFEACEELAEEATTSDIVVVTHVSPLKAAVAWALEAGADVVWRMFVDLASVTRIAISDRGPLLRSFNETHHLQAM